MPRHLNGPQTISKYFFIFEPFPYEIVFQLLLLIHFALVGCEDTDDVVEVCVVDLRSDLPHPVAQAVERVSPCHVEDEENAVSVAVELVTNISEHVQPGSVEDVNRNLREEVKLFCL